MKPRFVYFLIFALLGISILVFASTLSVAGHGPIREQIYSSIHRDKIVVEGSVLLPVLQIIFHDNFDDGNADGWTTVGLGTWYVENGEYIVDMGNGNDLEGQTHAGNISGSKQFTAAPAAPFFLHEG